MSNSAKKERLIRVYSGVILAIWLAAPYLLVQQFAIREVTWMRSSDLDKAVGFHDSAIWVYFSWIVLLSWVGLRVERAVYLKYLYAIGWTIMAGQMTYFAFPNGLSREGVDLESAPMVYQWLVALDAPRNVFPSLHAGLATLAGIAATRSLAFKPFSNAVVWLWIIAGCVAAISLQQQVLLGVIAGAVVAAVCWWLVGKCCKSEISQ